MTSRRFLTVLAIFVWCAVALTTFPRTKSWAATAVTLAPAHFELAEDCSDLRMQFDRHSAVVQSEERTISKTEAPTLRVNAEANGGLQVEGWDHDSYAVTLCKAAESGSGAEDTLSQIHLSFQGGELGVTGPASSHRWGAHLFIRAPKAAALDVSTHNGPLSFYNLDGRATIHAQNGPVTLDHCSGEFELSSQNGPLTLDNNSGKLSVRAQNGPLTLTLSGDSWTGSGLEARANNGPVTVNVPSGYRSGVVVESDGHGPFQCHAAVCSEGRKTWDEDRKRVEFGSGPTLVRVSTNNGPVTVN